MSDHKLQFRIAVADLAAIDAARLELGLERTSFFRERPEAREMLTASLHNRASGARTTVSISVDEGTEAKFKQLQEAAKCDSMLKYLATPEGIDELIIYLATPAPLAITRRGRPIIGMTTLDQAWGAIMGMSPEQIKGEDPKVALLRRVGQVVELNHRDERGAEQHDAAMKSAEERSTLNVEQILTEQAKQNVNDAKFVAIRAAATSGEAGMPASDFDKRINELAATRQAERDRKQRESKRTST